MWFKYLLVVLWVIETMVAILTIGDARKPRTIQDGLLAIVIGGLLIWGLFMNWGKC